MVLPLLVLPAPWSRAGAPEETLPAASTEGPGVHRGRFGPEGVLVWRVRVGGASLSLDGFAPGPEGALRWQLIYSAWTYLARPEDPTPQGFSRYGVSGKGAWVDVRRVRVGDRVILFSISGPLGRPA